MKFTSLQSKSYLLLLLFLLTGAVHAWGQNVTYKLTKVTSVENNGLYVFEQGGYVMTNTITSSALQCTNDYKTTGLTGTEAYVWILESTTNGFKMRNVNKETNGLLTNNSSTNLSWSNSGSVWAFNFQTDGTVLIQNKSNSERFLGFTSSTSHAYKAYATSNLSNYPHAVVVYQLVEAEPLPEHTATFSINGTTSTADVKEGGAIAFPDVTNPDGYYFMGWTATELPAMQASAPADLTTEATMGTADVTYFAVFARKIPGGAATLTDVLTPEGIGQKTYGDWTGKAFTSSAVYAGNSTTSDNGEIQMRSNYSNSGIVTTTSGGKVTKVAITWPENVTVERTVDIYGKNTPYTAATDLYNSNKQGTKIGSLVNTSDTRELTITGDYAYIGLRSNNGAVYMLNISIDWFSESADTYSGYCTTLATTVPVTITAAGAASFSCTEALDFTGVTGMTAYAATLKTDKYVHLEAVEQVPAGEGIIVKGAAGTYEVPVATGEVTQGVGNLLQGTATEAYTVTQEDYDNDLVYKYVKTNSGQVGFQKAEAGKVIAVGKAFLKLSAQQAREFKGFAAEETTGINSLTPDPSPKGEGSGYYNLAGQKVGKGYKGIVIVQGKKVVR